MSTRAPLHVIACGLCSPLGLDRRATTLEMAAGADVFCETALLDDRGQPIRASMLSLLPEGASRTQRMCELAAAAFDEILSAARQLGLADLPVLLAVPEDEGGASWQAGLIWQALLGRGDAHGVRVTTAVHSTLAIDGTHRGGAAGLFVLLQAASDLLAGSHEHLVIGAVDSRCDPTSLIELARAERLIDTSPEGYLPGEGAGFVLLSRRVAALPGRLRPYTIVAHAHADEPRPFARREVSESEALTQVFRRLRVGPPAITRTDHALSCQWDASYWGGELARAYIRNADLLPEPMRVDPIAEWLGVAGAASAVLQLGHALQLASATAQRTLDPARVLIYGCAELGRVGACVVEASPDSALVEGPPLELPAPLHLHPQRDAFEADRLADHLELIGSLLVQRLDDRDDPPYPWPELEALEDRIRARVWACSSRGGDVSAALRRLLGHRDPDIGLAAAYVLVGAGSPEDRDLAVRRMLAIEDERDIAIWRSAFGHALHGQDGSVLAPLLTSPLPAIQCAALDIFDELELRPYELLLGLLASDEVDESVRARALGLLARSGAERVEDFVEAMWLADMTDPLTTELMLTLGRLDVLDQLRAIVQIGRPPSAQLLEVWALATGSRDAGIFAELAETALDELEPAHLWALSSFGAAEAVPTLLAALDHPDLALDAAIGLERILGAGMIEPTWLPDEDAEDPSREGETRLRVVVDPERWRAWWETHQARFHPSARYRFGRPLDHRARVEELARPTSLPRMRRQAMRELAAALGVPLYFGFNWPITVQHEAIARILHWLEMAE